MPMTSLEKHFSKFRENIIGINQTHKFATGEKKIVYADWTASGRLYGPIEDYLKNVVGPYVANTHTESSLTGTTMTQLYLQARQIIKEHVNATESDILITTGSGMTSVINKFQRILNMRISEQYLPLIEKECSEKPLVLITHMEHHSNQTSWLACFCDVEIIKRSENGLPDIFHLEELLKANQHRKIKIGSFSACSNVTGIQTPIHAMAEMMHKYNGLCFADFAASAPYVKINMHPKNSAQKLDAIFFSPHKFLGGPGSSGVLIFDKSLYKNKTPDQPGGGTVSWTNPWGEHRFVDDIEAREDGGTPGFLQAIRAALAILLKEEMGLEKIQEREDELKNLIFSQLMSNPKINILDPQLNRLGIISFYVTNMHFNLIVKLLNDRYGIQTRGGCSCAGTYGHILLNVDQAHSHLITCKIDQGDLSEKPGWVRVSLHPTMTNDEATYITSAIHEIIKNYEEWQKDYDFDISSAEFNHKSFKEQQPLSLKNIKFF
jgi:selenocysteine lyase/cysteine desulfurase